MRLRKFWWLASLACTATISALPATAQEREGEPRGPGAERGGMMMRMNPVLAALDANQDGEISAEEIEQAAAALKKLDADGDGKLTIAELGPARGRGGGEGAPVGGGGGGRGPQGRGPGGFGRGAGGPGGGAPGGGGTEMIARVMERDEDGDGKLTAAEAGERLAPLIERADADGDGAVTKEELLAAMPAGGGRPMGAAPGFGPGGPGAGGPGGPGGPGGGMFGNPEQFVNRLFQLDANDDGNLTREELMRIGEVLGAGRPPGEGPGRGPGEGRGPGQGRGPGEGRPERDGGREGGREEGRRAQGPGGRS